MNAPATPTQGPVITGWHETFADVTVTYADGEGNLGDLISRTPADEFDSFGELGDEINNTVPHEAVGEPYQSEGEGESSRGPEIARLVGNKILADWKPKSGRPETENRPVGAR